MTDAHRTALDPPEGELTLITQALVDRALAYSRTSPRQRVIQPFHKGSRDPLHRMLNAVQPCSYIRPHRHLEPPKAEAFIVMRGSLAFFSFAEDGTVRECVRLAADGARFGVDLVPGVYHAFVALEPDTLIYEVKTGPYARATDKEFAPFAPAEGSDGVARYMQELLDVYRRRLGLLSPGLAGVSRRPPVLRSRRLLLRGYEPDDAPEVFAYCSDPETTQYMFFDAHRTIGDAHDFLNSWVAEAYRKGELKYALCLADAPERIIGGIDLRVDPNQHRTMELGYILSRAHWGRGYMPEAARTLIAHAFETTDMQRIEAPIFAQNVRSRRAAEKMGMLLDGVLRSSRAARGQCWDVAIYAILRNDFLGKPGARLHL